MPSDYRRILKENVGEYGKGSRHLAFLGQLYGDRTHFIFELLQNAEDAGARRVSFVLSPDTLEIRHDGRPFDQRDVRGICGVQEGTKGDDPAMIGRFGVGFKAVYAYTRTPHIYSGDEHFRIVSFVQPQSVRERRPGPGWTTLFVFPFDHPEIGASQARAEISERLVALASRTLLFLRHIERIDWNAGEEQRGEYRRETPDAEPAAGPRRVRLTSSARGRRSLSEEWLLFERPSPGPDLAGTGRVELGFRLERDAKQKTAVIRRVGDSTLVVFFPTEKETHLGFLLQGPFHTTPARDNVPADSARNRSLVETAAALVVDSLEQLRDLRLLDVAGLETLPLRPADFPPGSMFRPIFDRTREALRTQPLLPAHDGEFVAGNQAKVARSAELVELLTPAQLQALLGASTRVAWLSTAISEARSPDLYRYIVGSRAGTFSPGQALGPLAPEIEVRPEAVIQLLTARFLEQQETSWFAQFYRFLAGQRDLWPRLRDLPILRLETGCQVAPRSEDGRPAAYLPSADRTTFPTIDQAIAADAGARAFLIDIGIRTPDVTAEVLEGILPAYGRPGARRIDAAAHRQHLERIAIALRAAGAGVGREVLVRALRRTPFVRSSTARGGEKAYRLPGDVYRRDDALIRYFGGAAGAYFLDDPAGAGDASLHSLWETAGIGVVPRIASGAIDLPERDRRALRGGTACSQEQPPIDRTMDGLGAWLERQARRRGDAARREALLLWGFLLAILAEGAAHAPGDAFHLFKGEYLWKYYADRRTSFDATWLTQLKGSAWLPDRNGRPHKPGELTLDDLPTEFVRERGLAEVLEMRPDAIGALAALSGMPTSYVDYVLRNMQQIMGYIDSQQAASRSIAQESAASDTDQPVDYAQGLRDAFHKGTEREPLVDVPALGAVANPARRRAKLREGLASAQREEPSRQERFARVPAKNWEGKDNGVRAFLLEQYSGRCQICQAAFLKRDGQPYFEARYLVSYTKARWIDRPGNALCLCATCSAKFEWGVVEADSIVEQIGGFRAINEGGAAADPVLTLRLCGTPVEIRFAERHLMDLQEMLRSALAPSAVRSLEQPARS